MNIKRFFGAILTALGICGLIYTAILFVNSPNSIRNINVAVMYSVLEGLFFLSGIGLVRTTKNEG